MVMCGPWEPRLCVYCTPSWSQVDWLLCVSMVSDAVTMLVGKARHRQKSCLTLGFSDPGDSFTGGATYIFRAS